MFQIRVVKKHMFNNSCPENHTVYDKVEKYVRAGQAAEDNVIRRMRFACLITEDSHTVGICNTYCFSSATVVARTRVNVTLYSMYIACIVNH